MAVFLQETSSNGVTILKGKLMVQQILVAIAFLSSKSLEIVETKNNDQSRILKRDIKICDKEVIRINLYNANTEKEQLDTLTKLSEMVKSIPNILNKNT